MLLGQAEEPQRQMISLPVVRLCQIAPLLEAEKHSEDLGYGAVQEPSNLAYCQAAGRAGKEFQNVQPFLKRWSRVVPLGFRHEVPSKCLIHIATW